MSLALFNSIFRRRADADARFTIHSPRRPSIGLIEAEWDPKANAFLDIIEIKTIQNVKIIFGSSGGERCSE